MKMTKTDHFCFCSTPLRIGVGVHVRLSEPEAKFSEFSNPLRRRNPRSGEPLRLGIALLRLGVPASPFLVPLFR